MNTREIPSISETQRPKRPRPTTPTTLTTQQTSSPRLKAQPTIHSRPLSPRSHVSFIRAEDFSYKMPSQVKPTRATPSKPRLPYGRRKVPANQQLLLNENSSWLPSLPGCHFPRPNVPIELLTKWNSAPSPSQRSTAAFNESASHSRDEHSLRASSSTSRRTSREQGKISPSSSSRSTDDSDEPVDESDWPLSQPQARPDLPPDSSTGTFIPGTADDLVISPPKPLTTHDIARRAAQQRSSLRHPLHDRAAGPIPETERVLLNPSLPGLYVRKHSSPQVLQPSSSPARSHAQRTFPTSSGPSASLNGSRHAVPFPAKRGGDSTPSSQDRPAGQIGKSHATRPANQTPLSSQVTRTATIPPQEFRRQAKREWRER